MSTNIAVYELADSGTGSVSYDFEAGENRECTRRFLIGQCDGFNQAVELIEPYAPQYILAGYGPFWTRRKLDIKPVGNRYYDVSATWSTLLPRFEASDDGGGGGGGEEPLAGGIAWDTTGHTTHITQAFGTTAYPAGGPDIYDAINMSGDSVNGLDVVRPSLRYSETWIVPAAMAVGGQFISSVYSLTGTVNNAPFRFFDAGEVLFMGARAQWQGGDPFVAVTFDFECRPNRTAEYVKGIAQFPIKGWQYMWVMYEPKNESDRLVQMPIYAYVQDVYQEKDWTPLMIPGLQPAKPKRARSPKPPKPVAPAGPLNLDQIGP
jgi:hypothetical protein